MFLCGFVSRLLTPDVHEFLIQNRPEIHIASHNKLIIKDNQSLFESASGSIASSGNMSKVFVFR